MSLFEFVVAILSIIVALGIAEILGGLARLVRDRSVCRPYWLHLTLVAAVLLAFLQTWWEAWSLRGLQEWTFPALLLMVAPEAMLFVVAHLLFPRDGFEGSYETHYFAQAPAIFILVAGAGTLSAVFRPIVLGHAFVTPEVGAAFLIAAGCLFLAFSVGRAIHGVLVPLGLVVSLWDALAFGYSLS
jgi:hypothetical protein